MSRNTVVTPEGPGQGQSSSSTDINSHDVIHSNKQFLELQYPVYTPPIYHYPLPQPITSLLPIPTSIPSQLQNTSSQSIAFQSNAINKKSYAKKQHQTGHNRDSSLSSNKNKKSSPHSLPKSKAKTVDLSRNNSRGELETLVRWIGGDSVQIKHHCSQDAVLSQWRCVCSVPLPFKNNSKTLQTKARHSKKKDAIKIASKLMIEEILKEALPIAIDIIDNEGNVTSVAAQIAKQEINAMKNREENTAKWSTHNVKHKQRSYSRRAPRAPYDYDPYSGPPPFPPYNPSHAYYSDWCSYHHHHHHSPSWSGYHSYYGGARHPSCYPPYDSHHHHHCAHNKRVTPSDAEETSTSTVNGDADNKDDDGYLFEDNKDHDAETDDGDITQKNPSDDEHDDEYLNELKEEEISPQKQAVLKKKENCADDMKAALVIKRDENDIKLKHCNNNNDKHGEEKEMEGEKIFAIPPQRLLVLVPSQIEYKTIRRILPQNTQIFTFSKKLEISGLVVPAFTHLPDSTEQESMQSMQESPGEQNRLYIVQCGTGLVNVSVSIATVVQTVHIDAILLLGSAISLQPKSIKPGHLLLPNTVIQHDLCSSATNNAIFKTHCKLSQWLRSLIAKGSEQENESLPVIYRGALLSGSEIIKSEARISYLASATSSNTNGGGEVAQHYDEAMAVDRESISVAIICRTLRIPFVVLKSIAPPHPFDTDIDFKAYDDASSNNTTFDCNSSVPLLKALLEEYRMFHY